MNAHEKAPALSIEEWRESICQNAQREFTAFLEMRGSLISEHRGEFVAISGGKVVDRDTNESVLAERVALKFADRFVLIQKVTDTP